MTMPNSNPLMLGVDYYPEHWPADFLEKDLAAIRATGANTIRIGEFAWHLMESLPGQYDFSFFDTVIEKAKAVGLAVIFGTPTATFPAWLAAAHPEILSQNETGQVWSFGGRRQYCFNSPAYQKAAEAITEKLVAHYGQEPAVIAWQVDNEFGHEGSDFCFCEICHEEFQQWLEETYQHITHLNEAWGTIFWGQTYNTFNEIPSPRPTITTHNPSLLLDWARFRSDAINGFARQQITAIRRHKGDHQLVTHNLFGGYFNRCYDQNTLADMLDVVSFDNYPVWGGLEKPISPARSALALDYIRGLKQQNFWILEQLMGSQGHQAIGYLPRPDQAVLWSFQAMARGCEALLYFRWRGMTRGAEQFCLGLIDQDNRQGRKVQEASGFFGKAAENAAVFRSPVKSQVCALYDFDSIWSWHYQPQSAGFDYETEFCRLYEPFYQHNIAVDVLSTDRDFSGYRVLLVPVLQIVNEALVKRLEAFASAGGIVVFTFRTGIKDKHNNLHFLKTPPCLLRNMMGLEVTEAESLGALGSASVSGCGPKQGQSGEFAVWRDLITPLEAEVLYRYDDSPYQDFAAVTRNSYGRGWVYTVGGGADMSLLMDLAAEILQRAEIPWIPSVPMVEVVTRELGDGGSCRILMNHSGSVQSHGDHRLAPYEVLIAPAPIPTE